MIHVKNDSSIVTSLTSQSLAANQPEVNKGKLTTIMSTQIKADSSPLGPLVRSHINSCSVNDL